MGRTSFGDAEELENIFVCKTNQKEKLKCLLKHIRSRGLSNAIHRTLQGSKEPLRMVPEERIRKFLKNLIDSDKEYFASMKTPIPANPAQDQLLACLEGKAKDPLVSLLDFYAKGEKERPSG